MSPTAGFPEADREQLAHFVAALFANASEGTASLRAFPDDKRDGPPVTRPVSINGVGLEPLIDAATEEATKAARSRRPMVFAPPIALFAGERADEGSLLEGLTLSVELDERPAAALATLRAILGPPTLVVVSGGTWTDPATGEVRDKLHLHWRLKEPTASPGEHARLKRARELACGLVGADPTAKSAVHPMRWPGSWHRKDPASPRLCRIAEENPAAEIALEDALAELEGLAALRGETAGDRKPGAEPTAEDALVVACLERLANPLPPNPDEPDGKPREHWDDWNRIGMAAFRASGGSEAAFAASGAWSARHETKDATGKPKTKYDPDATRARWEHYRTSPPARLGIGTLIREARLCDPGFRPKREEPPPGEPPATPARPLIVVRAGELTEVVGRAQAALEGSREVYRYGGVLAHLERVAKDVERPQRHVPAGTLEVVPCTPIWLTLELARVADFEKVVRVGKNGPEFGACDPPQKIAATVLEDARGWQVLVLTGTAEVPILRDDGSVRALPGYDPETGLFLDPGGVRFPDLPAAPTKADAKTALAELLEPLEEFPFVEEHHRSAALALILTAVRRRQLPAAPMFGVSAREAGSGKGLLVDVASVIATGRRAPATPFSPKEEEQRKFITSALTAGHSQRPVVPSPASPGPHGCDRRQPEPRLSRPRPPTSARRA